MTKEIEDNRVAKPVFDRVFYKTMLALALPVAMQNLIAAALSMVDTLMIGQLGENELAAVGLANQLTFLLHLFIFGIASGTAIFTAQYWGNRDITNVRRLLGLGLLSAAILAFLFNLISFFFPRALLSIFTSDPTVLRLGSDYLRIVGFSFFGMAFSFTLASVFRSIGQVKMPMLISACALAINTLLNYIFIFGQWGFPALGVRGAALATLAARMLEWIFFLFFLYNGKQILAAKPLQYFHLEKAYLLTYYKTTLPVVMNESIWGIGVTMYTVVYARMGTEIVAAINIAATVERLLMVLFFGLANAAAVMVGQQIGAANMKTAFLYGRRFLTLSPLLGLFCGILLIAISPFILSLFQVSQAVHSAASGILLVYGLVMSLRVFNILNIVGVLRSGGDTRFTLMLDTIGVWGIAVPLAFVGGLVLRLPIEQVVGLIVLEEAFKAIVGFGRFRSKKWIHRLVGSKQAAPTLPSTTPT